MPTVGPPVLDMRAGSGAQADELGRVTFPGSLRGLSGNERECSGPKSFPFEPPGSRNDDGLAIRPLLRIH